MIARSPDRSNAVDLGTGTALVPNVTLSGIPGPQDMAFDRDGNLWVSSYTTNQVLAFAAADLTTSGSKVPRTTLTADGALSLPVGVRFSSGAR